MPKKPQPKKSKPTSAIAGLSLLDIDLSFDPSFEDVDDVELNYSLVVTPPKFVEDSLYFFNAKVIIGKGEKGSKAYRTAIRARYFCGLQCENMDAAAVELSARKYAQTVIWGNFASLAAIVTQQMRAEFPVLPPMAATVRVEEDVEEGDDDVLLEAD
ncbi:hypothetical protein QWE_18363 [Agrobacterium albertimagni AOL15]|uniref:Uncharacterized protein n=1 Tax=Agrobacterium albertimagni AOL15 TaxID=1156935 RepID=K2QC41_9HYPH|nr:hypothetical protein [Agrobacterium albertimagni]EKF58591.1 hypothetical protein QWE_18363 [Agrobacterium albertimagni AOL15]